MTQTHLHEEQFNLRKRHPWGRLHLVANELESSIARRTLKKSLDVAYGESPGQRLDIFPASQPDAPVFVFIHGGYFRALDKRQYNYIARPFVAAGCTVVLINYDLAPNVPVKEIVEQNLRAFRWIYENIERWHGNPRHMVLCGHSVGAFLVAKILEAAQDPEIGWDTELQQAIYGAVLLSGLYDLTKMRQSYLNESLHLSEEDVQTLSPIFGRIHDFPHAIVAVGEHETVEFIQQSRDYAHKLEEADSSQEFLLLKNKNHYSVSRMLSRRNNPLIEKILRLLDPNLTKKT